MIVNLAELRQQRLSPPPPEFDPADPRRRNRLSLEQQKKRAKDLLHAIQSNDADAIARFQRHSPECLSAERIPHLHDAQDVIARENGFRKWTGLKAHIDRISVEQQVTIEGRPSALDDGQRTLHIRCGSDIMHDLAVGGFSGDFLSFADPYVLGPVPRTESLEEFVRIRANYLAPGDPKVFEGLYGDYRDLEKAHEYPIVNIWMEHDSHDQLILARLLHFFSDPSHRPPRLRMINVTHFPGFERFVGLGQLPAQALRLLWDDFEDVTEAQLLLGHRVWNAITSPSPEGLIDIIKAGTEVLSTFGPAIMRHLRELPSAGNGLSLSEQLTLQILLDKGGMTAARLWGWYNERYEPLPFMGDTGYWAVIAALANAEEPALRTVGGRAGSHEVDPSCRVELLPFGERLLRNEADWLEAHPPERWIGGVRIDPQDQRNWRLDDASETVKRV